MSGLVGYDSEDSDFDDGSSSKVTVMEKKVQNSAKTTGDLEAEWESFERLISGGGSPGQDEDGGKPIPGGVPCPAPHSKSIFVGPTVRLPFVEEAQASYENSLAFQKTTSNTRGSSNSDQNADSDMDVCSNSSEEKDDESADQPPPAKRQKTCSTSSSLKMTDAPNSDDDSSSESEGSRELYRGKANVNQHSESEDSDDDEPCERQRSSSKSESESEHEDVNDAEHLETLAGRKGSSSSMSNKSASPKTKSPVEETGKRNPKSNKARSNADKALETRSSSQDRLRTKLMALAKEKVRRSKSRSRSRERTNVKRSHHSPSASHRHVRGRDSHRRHGSKSRERHRRSRSREAHKRRHHSRSRSPRRHHQGSGGSRSRHRYHDRHGGKPARRSHERRRSGSRSRPKLTFKEQLRAQMLQAQQQKAEETSQDVAVIENKALLTANEKKSALPLNSPNPLVALMSGAKDKVTPQQALMQTMAAVHAKAQEMTGVAVPSYYNPAAVNPIKYAEQLKKRKLLWSKNKETKEPETDKEVANTAQWTSTSFAADNDGKMAAKFRKLMGIKEEDQLLISDNVDISKLTEDQRKRQEELFMQLDREYAFARMTTHTHRGIGLGFQSQGLPDV